MAKKKVRGSTSSQSLVEGILPEEPRADISNMIINHEAWRDSCFAVKPNHTVAARISTRKIRNRYVPRSAYPRGLGFWNGRSHSSGAGRAAQLAMPRLITVREARVRIDQPGFRSRSMVIVTTLLNPIEYSKEDLANFHRAQWNNDLDLRTIKSVMQMDCPWCKTPELTRWRTT
ncbi:MAG TPA: hypothetical protein DDW52_04140 [Planctomycetaceae bacterium]|nr:hypothetical protein [Planctomycetaceae bacterium]